MLAQIFQKKILCSAQSCDKVKSFPKKSRFNYLIKCLQLGKFVRIYLLTSLYLSEFYEITYLFILNKELV